MSAEPIAAPWVTDRAVILDPTGLHARPAVRLARLAMSFGARIEVKAPAGEGWVDAKSPSAVMKLRAGHRTVLTIRAQGSDASRAVAALCDLVAANFADPPPAGCAASARADPRG
ncbi:MAG: HPr family phosphocarrier protein [Pseudomonadota bacterium]